ncbi:YihY/virulence factor BrkB family protein [Maribellus sp. YY47]|uniref:YihY/virulence factor BrkB family protein n=1 Tax=Maribellus sp. YY47 TaxID=2929486 RepID=UPI00200063A5|nr:YihY/virulence factor BrkB family protein [Maribellus sp. YY47]MCK3683928.1 YihY/virulence factor BrkB family protein [Maribellus sp. YY47]
MGTNQTFGRLKKLGEKIVERAKKISFPLFDGVPLYDVAVFFWRSIVDGSITTRASAIAFSFFVALFPFIIFLFTLIPYIKIPNFQDELFLFIKQMVPSSTFSTIEDTLIEIITIPRSDRLSINFFAALFFATNGLAGMMSAFDATIHSIQGRSWWSQRITAIYMLIVLSVLLTIAIALLTGGQQLINYLDRINIIRDDFLVFFLTISKWVITVALFFFAYSFLYYMAPAKKIKWRFISAGGTLTTVLSIVGLIGFTYYINNFSQYNALYGSIGTLLIILLLMYLMSLILLIGFELNASIYEAHTQQSDDNKSKKSIFGRSGN